MVKSYLEKRRQELLELQIDLTNQVQKIDKLMKEKIELLQYIESSEDVSYDFFSPQNYQSDMNHQKIDSIKNELEHYEEEVELLRSRHENVKSEIKEIDRVIQTNKENEMLNVAMKKEQNDNENFQLDVSDVLEIQELERRKITIDLYDSVIQNLTGVIHRIELCKRLMDVDKPRCKIELDNMSRTILDMIKKMQEDLLYIHSTESESNQEGNI